MAWARRQECVPSFVDVAIRNIGEGVLAMGKVKRDVGEPVIFDPILEVCSDPQSADILS